MFDSLNFTIYFLFLLVFGPFSLISILAMSMLDFMLIMKGMVFTVWRMMILNVHAVNTAHVYHFERGPILIHTSSR